MTLLDRGIQRIRHELKFRLLTVAVITDVTPLMRRITLAGDELAGFTSLGFDDHVKVFFPEAGKPFPVPERGDNGLVWPPGLRPEARDYTPRSFDPATNRLALDFVLHGDGPASTWAATTKVGDLIGIGGPRGSMIVAGSWDYHLLVGDETALPAIGRRIEELPAGTCVIARIEVAGPAEEQHFATAAQLDLKYLHRNGAPAGSTSLLADALSALTLPQGIGFHFIAGEAYAARAARGVLEQQAIAAKFIKAAGYWQREASDFDDGHQH